MRVPPLIALAPPISCLEWRPHLYVHMYTQSYIHNGGGQRWPNYCVGMAKLLRSVVPVSSVSRTCVSLAGRWSRLELARFVSVLFGKLTGTWLHREPCRRTMAASVLRQILKERADKPEIQYQWLIRKSIFSNNMDFALYVRYMPSHHLHSSISPWRNLKKQRSNYRA